MAAGLQYLAKVSQSQELDKTYNSATGDVGSAMPQMWMYNASAGGSDEASATVQGANYFDFALGYLSPGDLVYVFSNDPAYHLLNIATNTGVHVTTAQIV